MAWSVVFSRRALRDLQDLDEATGQLVVGRIRTAGANPSAADLKKLGGRPFEWRIRVGSGA
jgi:mRNA-degrading endonuclease RelE of RelBE toxin-antitoxin system